MGRRGSPTSLLSQLLDGLSCVHYNYVPTCLFLSSDWTHRGLAHATVISPASRIAPGTHQGSIDIWWMNRTHQQSMSASCFCISQEVTAGKSRIGQKIHVQPETLGAWSSPGPSARASCSGFPEAGLQAESHGEGSQPGLGPPQPRGQWVSHPVQHRPCKRTRLSSSTNLLG